MLLRLRMSPYAYAYRTCKHPCVCACAYAYACVVRVNQALMSKNNRFARAFYILVHFFAVLSSAKQQREMTKF